MVTIAVKASEGVGSAGRQKFRVEAGLTPLAHVQDVNTAFQSITSPVLTHSLQAVFPPTGSGFSPLESPRNRLIRTSYSTVQSEYTDSVTTLQTKSDDLDREKSRLLTRLSDLQADARRNYLGTKEVQVTTGSSEFGLFHVALAGVLGLLIGIWMRT